jgi:hypothetical protein
MRDRQISCGCGLLSGETDRIMGNTITGVTGESVRFVDLPKGFQTENRPVLLVPAPQMFLWPQHLTRTTSMRLICHYECRDYDPAEVDMAPKKAPAKKSPAKKAPARKTGKKTPPRAPRIPTKPVRRKAN